MVITLYIINKYTFIIGISGFFFPLQFINNNDKNSRPNILPQQNGINLHWLTEFHGSCKLINWILFPLQAVNKNSSSNVMRYIVSTERYKLTSLVKLLQFTYIRLHIEDISCDKLYLPTMISYTCILAAFLAASYTTLYDVISTHNNSGYLILATRAYIFCALLLMLLTNLYRLTMHTTTAPTCSSPQLEMHLRLE